MGQKFRFGDLVYKFGTGYEGPGIVVTAFTTWTGTDWNGEWRYVVAHQIVDGKGVFYHIYSAAQLRTDPKKPPAGG